MTGCTPKFVFAPNPPVQGARELPFKIAVRPFEDRTEDSAYKGREVAGAAKGSTNLARTCNIGYCAHPALFGKHLAEDLDVSGLFEASYFAYAEEDVGDAGVIVTGSVDRFDLFSGRRDARGMTLRMDLAVSMRAVRTKDGKLLWEETLLRQIPVGFNDPVGRGVSELLRGVFSETRRGLAAALRKESVADILKRVQESE